MFTRLLRQKENVLRRLLPVSKRQLEIVRSENVEDLLSHLGRKSKLTDELEDIERQLVPFKALSPEERVWKNEEERNEVRDILERCNELLKQILEWDRQSTEELAAQRMQTETELKQARQSAQVHNAYARRTKTPKHFERNG